MIYHLHIYRFVPDPPINGIYHGHYIFEGEWQGESEDFADYMSDRLSDGHSFKVMDVGNHREHLFTPGGLAVYDFKKFFL